MRNKRHFLKTLLAIGLAAFGGQFLQAQEEGLRLHFDFDNASGTSVADKMASGITASLKNGAAVKEMGERHVLDLGNGNGYLDLGAQAGNLFRGLDSYTISMYYRVADEASLSGAGFFLWSFSTEAACTQTAGKFSAYRLNAQRFANSTGGWGNEHGIEIGAPSEKGKWMHVLYTQNGANGTLYLNGEQRGSSTDMPLNTANFTEDVPYAWIGRPPFSADQYLKQTLVADIRLYDRVLGTEEIKTLSETTDALDHDYMYGTPGDFTELNAAIEKATGFVAEHAGDYPAAAVALLQDEINLSQDIAREGLVNQDIIDERLKALESAQRNLEATAGFDFDDTGIAEGYDTDRGFRHPGALHTDADFERIRQQIANGNEKVVAAYNKLKSAAYSQANADVAPVVTIIRGEGAENYIQAARAGAIAYQNALRWKIDGTTEHADNAVRILNAWARTTTGIGGNSNYALAAGLYGYAFANAAELMRDYEGWNADDFEAFRRWMLDVWYPSCIGFLRHRNGTWDNADKWWDCPGHYWSNWGLCNALAVVSIGILCDDVFIYNQGMSFFKYDQVGTFQDPRTANPILNDGLTEFLGNLVVTTTESDLETGAYGKLGQMQESGRDMGHAAMAGGLAVDLAHIGWNQGDDLFSYMDHRLAAGIEYLAAQCQGIQGLPWTNYHYATNGYYWSDSRAWLQTGPALGAAIRPYWGTVIGHYEGVKGVKMPFSEWAYEQMGIDGGGEGSTSGGYDHMGYSVLMNTRDEQLAPADKVPTPLTPVMEYNGVSVEHNELGGLKSTYRLEPTETLPAGTVVTLKPQLPQGTADTGNWRWNTGETSKDITIVADRSGVWRATYTNENGVESEQVFTIAVEGDCEECTLRPNVTYNGTTREASTVNAFYGSEVGLSITPTDGWGFYEWETGSTASSITLPHVTTSRDVAVIFTGQGGRRQKLTFHINVQYIRPDIVVNGGTHTDTPMIIVEEGDNVTLTATPADGKDGGTYRWSDGSTGEALALGQVTTSGTYTLEYTVEGVTSVLDYQVYVKADGYATIPAGDYYIRHLTYGTYLTNPGDGQAPSFQPQREGNPAQQWRVENTPPSTTYGFQSLLDQAYLKDDGSWQTGSTKPFRLSGAVGVDEVAIQKSARTGNIFWQVDEDGRINFTATAQPTAYPFEFIPVEGSSIGDAEMQRGNAVARTYYTLGGIKVDRPGKGIYIRQTRYDNGTVKHEKVAFP